MSEEVGPGQLMGCEFLGGRVIAVRGDSGVVRVQSAYCPHMGADLSQGRVIGENVECAFHRWQYDGGGQCVMTGIGDPAPSAARIYNFPTIEKFGIVWAYNGVQPKWELPELDKKIDGLVQRNFITDEYSCDGWVFSCNTPDMQHIKAVHGIQFKHDDPHKDVRWLENGFDYAISADHQGGVAIDWIVGIRGSSFFWQQGTYEGWWMAAALGYSCPRPGFHRAYVSIFVENAGDTPEGKSLTQERLDIATDLIRRTAEEDRDILNTIHYAPGVMTRGDTSLGRYLQMLRSFPRSNPAADFIR
ncbi:Rieske 2Fe-2S domain-containing protein [Sphingomonas paeninsulae]|uniref:Rieske 2Fe-2S domain-containing protein n=1 Tax=Sphingomonas paeninsulae TaxID=2319844 RepID=UPI001EEFCCAF|nr:Rieske 2Fe-2S domain-containing protein [Sphingomonas paeninsulae]